MKVADTPEPDDVTTSHPFCGSCTGCLFVSVLSTRSHAWFISRWLARLHHTSPTTSNSLPTAIAVSCVLPPPGRASSHGPTTTSVTKASLQRAHACGTGSRCIYGRTRTMHASSANWKHLCLWTSQPRRIVTIALMRHRSTLTYLLTLLTVLWCLHSVKEDAVGCMWWLQWQLVQIPDCYNFISVCHNPVSVFGTIDKVKLAGGFCSRLQQEPGLVEHMSQNITRQGLTSYTLNFLRVRSPFDVIIGRSQCWHAKGACATPKEKETTKEGSYYYWQYAVQVYLTIVAAYSVVNYWA